MTWDEAKLDALLAEMTNSVRVYLADKQERATGETLGYWMYQLQDCKKGK